MPFHFQILHVRPAGKELELDGKITQGAYGGPEAVRIANLDGAELSTVITSHAMLHPENWPVTPADEMTVLTIRIPNPAHPFRPDTSKPVIGMGCVVMSNNRINISQEIENPLFWASILGYKMETQDIHKPSNHFWGIDYKRCDDYYTNSISAYHDKDQWPYLLFPIDAQRAIEYEFAAGIEYQMRCWALNTATGQRALLGYHSGHFSLPAFRAEETLACAARLAPSCAAILLLTATSINRPIDALVPTVADWFSRVPGLLPGTATLAASTLLKRVSNSPAWSLHPQLGWTNDGNYSQRNPDSPWSILSPQDFEFIQWFFQDL